MTCLISSAVYVAAADGDPDRTSAGTETQTIVVYRGEDYYQHDPANNSNTRVWASITGCLDDAEDDCDEVGAEEFAEDVEESIEFLGEPLGILRTRGRHERRFRSIRGIVTPRADGTTNGAWNSTHRTIILPEDWQNNPGVVHHEVGHDFVWEYLERFVRNGGEQMQVFNEGFANAVATTVGGRERRQVGGVGWRLDLQQLGIHAAGDHIVEAYHELRTALGDDRAATILRGIVTNFEDEDGDGRLELREIIMSAVASTDNQNERQAVLDAFEDLDLLEDPIPQATNPTDRDNYSPWVGPTVDLSQFLCFPEAFGSRNLICFHEDEWYRYRYPPTY